MYFIVYMFIVSKWHVVFQIIEICIQFSRADVCPVAVFLLEYRDFSFCLDVLLKCGANFCYFIQTHHHLHAVKHLFHFILLNNYINHPVLGASPVYTVKLRLQTKFMLYLLICLDLI